MGYLQAWINKKKPEFLKAKRNKKLDMLALAVMNLKLCDPEAAQAALSSLKPVITVFFHNPKELKHLSTVQ